MMKLINPIYKKELKQAARMKRTVILILFYNSALALFGLFAYYVSFNSKRSFRIYVHYSGILAIYAIITAIETAMLLIVVPSLTAAAVAGEREKQTLDILLTTGIPSKKIVNGKLLASISTVLLLAVSSLPVISIVFSIGGISLFGTVLFMLYLIITAIYIGSIGIFFSCVCKKTVTATICACSAMLFLTIGTSLIFYGAAVMYNYAVFGSINHSSMLWYSNKLGGLIYMLLLNPIVSYISMIKEQTGLFVDMFNGIIASGNMPLVISKNWFILSMIVQLAVSAVILRMSAYWLEPHSRHYLSSKKSKAS